MKTGGEANLLQMSFLAVGRNSVTGAVAVKLEWPPGCLFLFLMALHSAGAFQCSPKFRAFDDLRAGLLSQEFNTNKSREGGAFVNDTEPRSSLHGK